MGIRVHRHANVAVAHQVLQCLGIHAGSCHVAAVGMPAYMRSDAGKLHPIDLVVAVHHVLEPVLPVHGYLGRPVFIQVEEAGAAVYHDLLLGLSPFCNDSLEAFVDFMENRVINIDHQLQRLSDMRLVIEATKTNAGTRKLPMTDEVYSCFQAILEDRPKPKVEKMVDGYSGFLYLDKAGLPLVALHWEHRMKSMVDKYNRIYRVQMPRISPHVCRHTYCSNMAKAGMNPKTLQYLMGHSDIGVTLNIYTHLGLEDAAAELKRLEDLKKAQAEMEKMEAKEKPVSKNMFRAI